MSDMTDLERFDNARALADSLERSRILVSDLVYELNEAVRLTSDEYPHSGDFVASLRGSATVLLRSVITEHGQWVNYRDARERSLPKDYALVLGKDE